MDRFWEKVNTGDPDECWEFLDSRNERGYGRVSRHTYGEELAHRLAWTIENGPIPSGLCVLHHCDNPPCCNPAHLYAGTRKENARDRAERGSGFQQALGRVHTAETRERMAAAKRAYWAAHPRPPKTCEYCGRDFKRHNKQQRFCSYSCSNKAVPRGNPPPRAQKLTEEQVHTIRTACDAGEMQTHVAQRFGVTQTTVSLIARRKSWGWLPER